MNPPQQQRVPERPAPYVSVACRMGAHGQCKEAEPRSVQPNWPVVYETCSCTWCHPQHEGAPMHTNSSAVSVTSATVMPGDVIQIGGQPLRVADMVALPHKARRLRFETGETLTMHARSRLAAFRPKGWW
jgi:hypothetical protein